MPRIRTVKPDYFTSGKQLRVSCEAAFLNICLWNYADDEGRLVDDAMEIAARCPRFFDVKGEKVERLLVELHASRLIHRYEHKQGKFIQCHDFENHQAIQKKKTSTIPTMSDGYCTDTVTLPERYCNATVGRKEGRKGRKGKERKGKDTVGRCPTYHHLSQRKNRKELPTRKSELGFDTGSVERRL